MTVELAHPCVVVTDLPAPGAAIPVRAVTAGQVDAGPAQPVYIVSAAQVATGWRVQAGPAIPMRVVSGRARTVGRPIAVYVVSGVLS